MAGSIVAVEIVLIIALSLVSMSVIMNIPGLVTDMAKLLELGSAETMAYDLAGFVTISAAAPDDITITHKAVQDSLLYSGRIEKRIVTIEGPFKEKNYIQVEGRAKTAIDVEERFVKKNTFTITKTTEYKDDSFKYEYSVDAK